MTLVLQILVGIAMLPLLALGVRSMLMPRAMGKDMGIPPQGNTGLNTVRAVPGGLFLASVTMLGLGLATEQTTWFLAVGIIMGAVMLGRIVGVIADGFDKSVVPPLVVEAVIGSTVIAAHLMTASG